MTRVALLALCMSIVALCSAAQPSPPMPRQKPVLLIVHSDSCPPCRIFDRVWQMDASFRDALRDAFEVKELDWDVPSQRNDALRLGVTRMPTYLVLKGNRLIARHTGFAGSMNPAEVDQAIVRLMQALLVEWPRTRTKINQNPSDQEKEIDRIFAPDSPRVPSGPAVDKTARDGITKLASETRELQQSQKRTEQAVQGLQSDVADVRSQVSRSREILSEQIKESHESTRSEITTITDRLKETIERTILKADPENQATVPVSPVPDAAIDGTNISTEMQPGPTASKWLAVLAWAGRTGLTIAAPEVAIPGSMLLTAAGFALQVARRRRAARQPAPLGHASNPIIVSDAGPKTETKFVVTESDVLGESYAEAIRRVGNMHRESQPQIIDVLKQVDSAAQQLAHGRRVVRRPTTEPTSEN